MPRKKNLRVCVCRITIYFSMICTLIRTYSDTLNPFNQFSKIFFKIKKSQPHFWISSERRLTKNVKIVSNEGNLERREKTIGRRHEMRNENERGRKKKTKSKKEN